MAGLPTGSIRRPRNAHRGPSAPCGRCARCARSPPPRSAGPNTCPRAVQPPAYRPSLAIGASRFGSGGKQCGPRARLPQSTMLRAACKPLGIKNAPGIPVARALLGRIPRPSCLARRGGGGRRRLAGPWPAKPTPTGGRRPPVGVVRAARARRPPRPAGCYFLPKGE